MPIITVRGGKVMRRAAVAAALVLALPGLSTAAGDDGQAARRSGYLEGQLLVATPKMGDPRFSETVIYMVKHNSDGALGLVLNRLLGAGSISDLLEGLGVESEAGGREIRVHYGGPVQTELGFVLHSTDYIGQGTLVVNGGLGFTTNLDILRAIAAGDGPARSLFALGYAGWGPGQLEAEIAARAWFSIPADDTLIFDHDLDSKWRRALEKRGVDL